MVSSLAEALQRSLPKELFPCLRICWPADVLPSSWPAFLPSSSFSRGLSAAFRMNSWVLPRSAPLVESSKVVVTQDYSVTVFWLESMCKDGNSDSQVGRFKHMDRGAEVVAKRRGRRMDSAAGTNALENARGQIVVRLGREYLNYCRESYRLWPRKGASQGNLLAGPPDAVMEAAG